MENFRKDIITIDLFLLKRSWYVKSLIKKYPDELKENENECYEFINAVIPFEKNETYDGNFIQKKYENMIEKIINTNLDKRNVFVDIFSMKEIIQKYKLKPYIGLFEIIKSFA